MMPGSVHHDTRTISDLTDDCLSHIFKFLSSSDLEHCTLVSRRWLSIESQNRHCLSLSATSAVLAVIPSLFNRFSAITTLALESHIPYFLPQDSINDEGLLFISLRCPNLTSLVMVNCFSVTDAGMAALAINCKRLKKFHCDAFFFGTEGMKAILDQCSFLEEFSLHHYLKRFDDLLAAVPVGPDVATSNNLRTLKLSFCNGTHWDNILKSIFERFNGLVEVSLEHMEITDIVLVALSNCSNMKILKLGFNHECSDAGLAFISKSCSKLENFQLAASSKYTNVGLVSIGNHCKLLRELVVRSTVTSNIDYEGLLAIAKGCPNLQVLAVMGFKFAVKFNLLAPNLLNLKKLRISGNPQLRDDDLSCIASECKALEYLCFDSCPAITYNGLEAFSGGLPDLVRVYVCDCPGITRMDWPFSVDFEFQAEWYYEEWW